MVHQSSDDGYFYRDLQGTTQGPLTNDEFSRAKDRGLIKPGFKVWRQRNGSVFMINVHRHFLVGKIFSVTSCGYFMELTLITISMLMIIYTFTRPKMQKEMDESNFLELLCFLTVIMTSFSIYTASRRLRDASSKVVLEESPV